MEDPYLRTFSYHYREKYGFPVGKIPLDLGVSCPNRRKGGCVFCHAPAFSPQYLQGQDDIGGQIREGKKRFLGNRFAQYFAYFQQETSTAVPAGRLLGVMAEVLAAEDCLGVIISTRPDYLDDTFLRDLELLIRQVKKECLFELGLQSVHDKSLKLLNRNHSYADFLQGFRCLRRFDGFKIGVHLLFGIPGESERDMLDTVSTVCDLRVDALKLHHLQVLNNTPLARLYERGEVKCFSLPEYFSFLLKILPLIPPNVVIHRLWATAHPAMLLAPKWNVLVTTLSPALRRLMQEHGIGQGCSL